MGGRGVVLSLRARCLQGVGEGVTRLAEAGAGAEAGARADGFVWRGGVVVLFEVCGLRAGQNIGCREVVELVHGV